MFNRRDVIYNYDGSFEGFLCCVFESYAHKEKPADIISLKNTQPVFLDQYTVTTDMKKAARVKKSIPAKMGPDASHFLQRAHLSCLERKEMHMLELMYMGYKHGPKVLKMLAEDTVNILSKAVFQTGHEAHKYTGFVRFSSHGNLLISSIKPKNSVLPIIAPHFAARLSNERFLIFDETNKQVCAYANGRYVITDADDINMPAPETEEETYRQLWKMFYDTIAVEGRTNPRCRMTLMPKRYWDRMTEFQTLPKEMQRKKEQKPNLPAAKPQLPKGKD